MLVEGFDRHYALFRECARAAKRYFEAGNWLAIGHVAGDRIDFYDRRVAETVERIERDFGFGDAGGGDDAFWAQVKQRFIALLVDHRQPECAETFFNTVSSKLLHRTYFHNRCLFVRPAVSTEYLDDGAPSYRCYYPRRHGLRAALIDLVLDLKLDAAFDDFRTRPDPRAVGDAAPAAAAVRRRREFPDPGAVEPAVPQPDRVRRRPHRQQRAHVSVRRGDQARRSDERLYVDALLTDPAELALLFSANRAYFLVDMEVPSAYVDFLRTMVPDKTASELYTILGLQKHGKTLFFRDFLHHLKHSTDRFVAAPGIQGLVMCVFTLPSYPYVFKVIRDRIAPSKDTDRGARQAEVRARQAPRSRRPHDRHPRIFERRDSRAIASPTS